MSTRWFADILGFCDDAGDWFASVASQVHDAMFGSPDPKLTKELRDQAAERAQVVWLFGKTESGKSSIVATLTGADVPIGDGFRPQTKASQVYDFPPEAPVLRFLDTRGLGEVDYDPAEDIAWCSSRAKVMIVTVRLADFVQGCILSPLVEIRRRLPNIPIVVALTTLHAFYPAGSQHPLPYPFSGSFDDERIPNPVRQALTQQCRAIKDAIGTSLLWIAPIDFTRPDDGFLPTDYGRDELVDALYTATHAEVWAPGPRADALVLAFATAAAGAAAAPLGGLAAVPAIQAAMLGALARRYNLVWTNQQLRSFFGACGAGGLAGIGLRIAALEALKFFPPAAVYAVPADIALSFATSCAIGYAADFYLRGVAAGYPPPDDEVKKAFRDLFRRSKR